QVPQDPLAWPSPHTPGLWGQGWRSRLRRTPVGAPSAHPWLSTAIMRWPTRQGHGRLPFVYDAHEGDATMPVRITLEEALKRADMSARELSKRSGAHRDTVSKYRHNAVRIINLDLIEAFCEVLHCRVHDILSDQPTPAAQPGERPATTVARPNARPAPAVQPTPVVPASPEREPKGAAWMSRHTTAGLPLPDGTRLTTPLAAM